MSADGRTVEPWFLEQPNGSQRPGYTGITYVPESNSLVAFGGPRALTLFRLSDATPTARTVNINGNFGSLAGTEKIKTFPSTTGSGSRLLGAKAPYIYSFKSTDGWNSASFQRFTRNEFNSNTLTSIVEYTVGTQRAAYGTGAYFNEGPKGGRTNFPAYKLTDNMLQ